MFIDRFAPEFGTVWLLRRFGIHPNAYYNYRKGRKAGYRKRRADICRQIAEIYHSRLGVLGYRQIKGLLEGRGIHLSRLTVYRYMHMMGLKAVVRRKKPSYEKGEVDRVSPNIVNREFTAAARSRVWCTDFTYLHLTDGTMRYNCTILDLYSREVVASRCSRRIDAALAIETLEEALEHAGGRRGILLHSDQGCQYTSSAFRGYCDKKGVIQSMSRAGCPYDNAPMERFFSTLKTELVYQKHYRTEEELYADILSFSFGWYNNIRPHTYNNGLPPAKVL